MLWDYINFLLQKASSSLLCGAGGVTVFAIIGGIDWLITRSWIEFKAKRKLETLYMQGVVVRSYNGLQGIEVADDLPVPAIQNKDDVLIKVMAAGTDPIDLKISTGYGRAIRFHLRKYYKANEFPVVLGRDCSGIVLDTGSDVKSISKGDRVWAVSSCYEEGLMAEYVVVKEAQVSQMPKKLNFQEAASLPYIGVVTLNGLMKEASLGPHNTAGKRVLVYASNSPYGLLAIQLIKAWGAHVTAVVPTAGLPMCRILDSDDVIVYSVTDFQTELQFRKKFDIVLNFLGTALHRLSVEMCIEGGKTVTMATCPSITDKYGLYMGFCVALAARLIFWLREVFSGIPYRISFGNIPVDGEKLNEVYDILEKYKIRPIFEVYPLDESKEAYRQIGSYNAVGRTVVTFNTGKQNGYIAN